MLIIPSHIKALLFDMDGTLVNTEPIGPEVFHTQLLSYGVRPTKEESELFVKVWRRDGTDITEDQFLTDVVATYQIKKSPSDYIKEFYKLYEQAIIAAKTLPGAEELLKAAHEHSFQIALVTSSKRTQAEAVLAFHGWEKLFTIIVSEEDVQNFKPNPEPFLVAMEKFHVRPQQTYIFEDAKNGAIAGHAAGCYVVGVRAGNEQEQDLTAADEVIASLELVQL